MVPKNGGKSAYIATKNSRQKCVNRNKIVKNYQYCKNFQKMCVLSLNFGGKKKIGAKDASFLDECMNTMHFVSNTTMTLKAMKTMYTTMNTIHFVLHLYAPEEEAIASKACAKKIISIVQTYHFKLTTDSIKRRKTNTSSSQKLTFFFFCHLLRASSYWNPCCNLQKFQFKS